MNENNQQVNGADKASIDQKVSGKRRLLMKGAAGTVPAILTLRSGAAFAMTSAETCIAKDNREAGTAPSPDVLTVDNSDVWVRSQVACLTLRLTSDPFSPTFQVYGEDFSVSEWRHEDYIYNSADPSEQVTYAFTGGVLTEVGGDPAITYSVISVTYCYVLVVMDEGGQPIEIGNALPVTTGLPYVTGSCWASAAPGLQ
ncbi:MAG: hypothetical protein methR_P2615 [Methyloprofundus sp.]|nr:MAG: hypothetical protein methR_P2615 [Methyloprofundus sp.]